MIELFEVVPIELTEVSFTERCSKSTISFRYITDEEAKVQTFTANNCYLELLTLLESSSKDCIQCNTITNLKKTVHLCLIKTENNRIVGFSDSMQNNFLFLFPATICNKKIFSKLLKESIINSILKEIEFHNEKITELLLEIKEIKEQL